MALDLSSSLNGALDDGYSAAFKDPKPQKEPEKPLVQLAGPPPTSEPKAPVESSYAKAERDLSDKRIESLKRKDIYEDIKSAAAKGEAAAKEAREAAVYAQYKPQLTAPYETFKPTGDTASSLASLGLMIGMLGAMGGKKGLTSATGAMNAIAGMMTGYQEGSKEKYERERKNFEENVKIAQQNHALIEKEFERAVKYAKYDLTGATNAMIKSSLARGDTTTANSLETRGLMKTASEVSDAGRRINGRVNIAKDEMRNAEYEVLKAEGETKALAAQRLQEKEAQDAELKKYTIQKAQKEATEGTSVEKRAKEERKIIAEGLKANNIRPRNDKEIFAWAENFGDQPFPKETSKEEQSIKGQIKFVQDYLGNETNNLGTKEIPKVASTIESAKLAVDLAEKVKKNPEAAGVVGATLTFLDKWIPSRYQSTDIADPERLAIEAANDPSLFKDIPADKISTARDIQKMVIDVINARALSASGGSRMLIAEFNAQKGVLELKDMSPESAVNLYNNVARRDLKALKQFGISEDGLDNIYNKIQPKSSVVKPTLEEYIAKNKVANPGYSDQELTNIYNQRFGGK